MIEWVDSEVTRAPRVRRALATLPLLVELLVVWDFAACAACGVAAQYLPIGSGGHVPPDTVGPRLRQYDILLESLVAALILRNVALADPKALLPPSSLVWEAEWRWAFAACAGAAIAASTRSHSTASRPWLCVWVLSFAAVLAVTRLSFGRFRRDLQQCGALREAIVIIGARGPRDRLAARISAEADIVGVYGPVPTDEPDRLSQEDISQLAELGRDGSVDSVVLAIDNDQEASVAALVERLKGLPIQVAICAAGEASPRPQPEFRILGGIPMQVVAERPLKRRDLLIKTLLDKVGALFLLLMLSPLMVSIALVIAGTSKGPIIFRQPRQGWCGTRFTVYKFRTMVEAPDGQPWRIQTKRNDERCTRVGVFLRSTSLDELPQLWNVLRGDMSLVGPRPHADHLHELQRAGTEIIAEYAQRNRVKPGITGWAQIHGARGPTHNPDQLRRRVAYDLYYIENWSPWLDLQILARTLLCLIGENVY